nr:MAG TPA: hypothetical protein [Caudoviricetes sp.]
MAISPISLTVFHILKKVCRNENITHYSVARR